jgi:hypothetical protein
MKSIDDPPILRAFRYPHAVLDFSVADWNLCLRVARSEQLLARLGYRLDDHGLLERCPAAARDLLLAARYYPRFIHTQVARELRHVCRSLAVIDTELIVLKGAAYLSTDFPVVRGRRMKDLDLLVRRERIESVEQQLAADGWTSPVGDPYDQHYYRAWMHELPPLRHPDRSIEVDLHHTVLPLTSRLKPDPEEFWRTAVPIPGMTGVYVLCPADMVLHTATHLFYDGEVKGGFNDLVDLDDVLRLFALAADFWPSLLQRADQMDLGRPLYYGLLFSRGLLSTPIPEEVMAEAARRFAPNRAVTALMKGLVSRVLPPQDPRAWAVTRGVSAWLLYVRSHWLRMPPALLLRHLARKSLRRIDKRTHRSLTQTH